MSIEFVLSSSSFVASYLHIMTCGAGLLFGIGNNLVNACSNQGIDFNCSPRYTGNCYIHKLKRFQNALYIIDKLASFPFLLRPQANLFST